MRYKYFYRSDNTDEQRIKEHRMEYYAVPYGTDIIKACTFTFWNYRLCKWQQSTHFNLGRIFAEKQYKKITYKDIILNML